ncbi:hypothetical protein [Desulfosporosinus metallidurans]|uniref:Uncharacterized protein n=1 Tax=Desulfosporosinus metallidurans TaxID=1888891 RepID=A0A1Q8QWP8_9FIRM|nr:hypothetical protein [Desulfosporosinus metallidurans]OLN31738.1 hypothetical protein DSOL_2426 [Desulfosporosinus metallidurans]
MAKNTLTLLLDRIAEDNRLPLEEAKRILRIILFKIDQWKGRK